MRPEDVPAFTKQIKSEAVERQFNKNKSVFRDWIEDTDKSLDNAFAEDISLWKLNKFVKDKKDREQVTKIMR